MLGQPLLGKSVGLVFFNSSLRTRASMAVAVQKLGGYPLIMDVGGGVWSLETQMGVEMTGDRPEHIKEAIPVLSRYVDLIGVRCFANFKDYAEDRRDDIISSIKELATVPVINLESAMHHPCQAVADMMTIQEKLGQVKGKKVVLSWAPHPKRLPMAVPNSFALAASQMGAHVVVACPKSFELDPEFVKHWGALAKQEGGSFEQTNLQEDAMNGADVVYAKSWGCIAAYESPVNSFSEELKNWRIDEDKMQRTNQGIFMHCLPVRRNVVVTDGVLDGSRSVVIDQAENRLHGQKAVLAKIARG